MVYCKRLRHKRAKILQIQFLSCRTGPTANRLLLLRTAKYKPIALSAQNTFELIFLTRALEPFNPFPFAKP